MIRVTRLDGKTMLLNAEWIQSVENMPDTLITLTTGFKLIVRDSADDVAQAFTNYKRALNGDRDIRKDAQ